MARPEQIDPMVLPTPEAQDRESLHGTTAQAQAISRDMLAVEGEDFFHNLLFSRAQTQVNAPGHDGDQADDGETL